MKKIFISRIIAGVILMLVMAADAAAQDPVQFQARGAEIRWKPGVKTEGPVQIIIQYSTRAGGEFIQAGLLKPENWNENAVVEYSLQSGERPAQVQLILVSALGTQIFQSRLNVKAATTEAAALSCRVFPNPARNQLGVWMEGRSPEFLNFVLVNSAGQEVLRQRANGGLQQYRLSVQDLPAGHYLLRAESLSGDLLQKALPVVLQ